MNISLKELHKLAERPKLIIFCDKQGKWLTSGLVAIEGDTEYYLDAQ